MNDNGIYGYNPEDVKESLRKVEEAYNAWNEALNIGLQNKFVKPMVDIWACPEAQQWFVESYAEAVKRMLTDGESTFRSINGAMNAAGQTWAERTGSSWLRTEHHTEPIVCDGSIILNKFPNGNIGINSEEARNIISALTNAKEEATKAFENLQRAVASSGFLGGSQQSQLESSIHVVSQSMQSNVGYLIVNGETAMKRSAEMYEQPASDISNNNFTVNEGGSN